MLERRPLSDRAIHGVRKDLKRTRAMLRMMRDALGDDAYRHDNAAVREVAHELGAVRDSKVLLDTLKDLPRRGRTTRAHASGTDLHGHLRRAHAHSRDQLRGEGAKVKRACRTLRAIRRQLARGCAGRYDWAVLEKGIRRVYARARTTLGRIGTRQSAENLHELRKQTKYLWHQLEALASADRGRIGPLARAAHRLSDLLGDDHNLTVLRGKVLETAMPLSEQRRLLARIDARRTRLVRQALTLARRIYRDPPALFAARTAHARGRESRPISSS